MDKNRRLCELLGLCWHEATPERPFACKICGMLDFVNQDFSSDPRLVLREMIYKSNFQEFLDSLIMNSEPNLGMIKVGYILDATGMLRDAAIKFLEEKK